jgi:hypothetical protein
MALDTYTNLQAAIGNFLNRTDLAGVIPDFITLAEAQISRRLQAAWSEGQPLPRAMVTRNAAFGIASEMVNVPFDFLGPIAFSIDSEAVRLTYLSPVSMAREKEKRGSNAPNDVPRAYTVLGSQFQFLPVPDTAYTGTLVYWQSFTPLSGGNPSNWILAGHPDVYLYGALTQAAPYLIDDARLATWGNLFTAGVADLLKADPLPNDGVKLRADEGLTFGTASAFDIVRGEFA